MPIFTEREAIKDRLASIRKEKEELRKVYQELNDVETELFNRLRELDAIGQEHSGVVGVYDIQSLISDLTETVMYMKDLVPKVPVQVLIDEIKGQYENSGSLPKVLNGDEDKIENKPKFREEVRESISREIRNAGVKLHKEVKMREKKRFSAKEALPVVREYMERAGVPVPLKTIINILDTAGFEKAKNSTERIKSLMHLDDKIQPVSRGYYQYVK